MAPYSHAVEADGWVFLTGQLPTAPGGGDAAAIPDGIEAQTRRTMDNLVIVLEGLGLDLGHVVAARVFLTRFEEDYDAMNAVYAELLRPRSSPRPHLHRGDGARARGPGGDRLHRAPAGELIRSRRGRERRRSRPEAREHVAKLTRQQGLSREVVHAA